MIRLARLVALSSASLGVAVATLLVALAAPVAAPGIAVAAAPNTASPSPGCSGCVAPLDAVCWEDTTCPEPVTVIPAATHPITVHYRTVPMSAKPSIDYVPVPDAVLTIPAGQTTVYVYVQLLPDPGMTQDKQFAIAFDDIVGGQLARPQATVTITPAGTRD
jgi:hypothetical protein